MFAIQNYVSEAWRFISLYPVLFSVYLVILVLVGLQNIAIPHIYGLLINNLKSSASSSAYVIIQENMYMLLLLLFVWAIFQALEIANHLLDTEIIPALQDFSREELIRLTMAKNKGNYAEIELGNVISKLVKFPDFVTDLFYRIKIFVFVHGASILFLTGYLFYCHWSLGLIFLCNGLAISICTYFFSENCSQLSQEREVSFDNMQESIQDSLQNLMIIFTSNKETEETDYLLRESKKAMDAQKRSLKCGLTYRVLMSILFMISFTTLVGVSFYLYSVDVIPLASFISTFILIFTMLKMSSSYFRDCANVIHMMGHFATIEQYFHVPVVNQDDNFFQKSHANALLQIKNVSVVYENVADVMRTPILKDINLSIQEGEKVAILGQIGSGKTTFAKVLVRLHQISSGQIYLEGHDIRSLSREKLRDTIRYVPQQSRLFNRTLYENICFGSKRQISESEILQILNDANLNDISMLFKERMHKLSGKNGSYFSGGQCQIVALLRVALNIHRIIILDEPTSAIDEVSKRQVLAMIKYISQRSTLIIITHDTSLLSLVDRKIVFDKGSIIEDTKMSHKIFAR